MRASDAKFPTCWIAVVIVWLCEMVVMVCTVARACHISWCIQESVHFLNQHCVYQQHLPLKEQLSQIFVLKMHS
jgi:hypothetical protein